MKQLSRIKKTASSHNKNNIAILIFVMLLISLYQFGWMIYIPCIPSMVSELHTTTSVIQGSIIVYMFGIALSQLVYGPISDIYGRKKTLFAGIIIFWVASLYIAINSSLSSFLMGRFFQGIGAGSLCVIGKSILSDRFPVNKLVVVNAWIAASTSISPILSQILGGYIGVKFSWKVNFYVLLCYSTALLFIAYAFFLETHHNIKQPKIFREIINNYFKILSNKIFYIYASLYVITLFSELLFQLTAPFEFQNSFFLPPNKYFIVAFCSEVGILAGSGIATILNKHLALSKAMFTGLFLLFISSLIIYLQYQFSMHSIYLILLSIILYFTSIGALVPLIIAGSLSLSKTSTGSVNSLMGSAQLAGVSFFGMLASLAGINTLWKMSAIILFITFTCCIVMSLKRVRRMLLIPSVIN